MGKQMNEWEKNHHKISNDFKCVWLWKKRCYWWCIYAYLILTIAKKNTHSHSYEQSVSIGSARVRPKLLYTHHPSPIFSLSLIAAAVAHHQFRLSSWIIIINKRVCYNKIYKLCERARVLLKTKPRAIRAESRSVWLCSYDFTIYRTFYKRTIYAHERAEPTKYPKSKEQTEQQHQQQQRWWWRRRQKKTHIKHTHIHIYTRFTFDCFAFV